MVKRIRVLSETQHDVVQAVSHSHQSCFVIEPFLALTDTHALTHSFRSLTHPLTHSLTHVIELFERSYPALLHWMIMPSLDEHDDDLKTNQSHHASVYSLTSHEIGRQGCSCQVTPNRQDLFGKQLYTIPSLSTDCPMIVAPLGIACGPQSLLACRRVKAWSRC